MPNFLPIWLFIFMVDLMCRERCILHSEDLSGEARLGQAPSVLFNALLMLSEFLNINIHLSIRAAIFSPALLTPSTLHHNML